MTAGSFVLFPTREGLRPSKLGTFATVCLRDDCPNTRLFESFRVEVCFHGEDVDL